MTAKRIRPPLYRKNLRQLHRDKGVCDDCGEKATHGVYCIKHWRMAKIRNARDHHQYVQKCKDQGRCCRCGRPLDPDADEGMVSCISCRERIGKGTPGRLINRRYYDCITVEEPPNASGL